jgi:hypothetical protein
MGLVMSAAASPDSSSDSEAEEDRGEDRETVDEMSVFRDGLLGDLDANVLCSLLGTAGIVVAEDADVLPLDQVRHLLRCLGFSDHEAFSITSALPRTSRDAASLADIVHLLRTGKLME